MLGKSSHPRFLPIRFQRGIAAIEFAILAVPLLLMLLGVTEYGRAIYQYNTLVKTVRDAARYLTTVSPGDGHVEARNLAVCGYIDCTGQTPLLPNLNTGMVKICDATTITDCPGEPHAGVSSGVSSVNLVTVKITQPNNIALGYRYQPLFASMTLGLVGGGEVNTGALSIAFDPIKNTMRQPL